MGRNKKIKHLECNGSIIAGCVKGNEYASKVALYVIADVMADDGCNQGFTDCEKGDNGNNHEVCRACWEEFLIKKIEKKYGSAEWLK